MRFTPALLLLFTAGCITVNVPRPDENETKDKPKAATTETKETKKEETAKAPEKKEEKTPSNPTPAPAPSTNPAPAPAPANNAAAAPAKQEAPKQETPKPAEANAKKKDEKPFEEVIKDKDKTSGLFTTYKDKEKFYISILPEQLGKNFILFTTLSHGIGEGWLLNGMPMNEAVLRFEKKDDKINIWNVNTVLHAPKGTPTAKAIAMNSTDALVASIKIETTDPDTKGSLIDIQNILLSDISGVREGLKSLGTEYGLKRDASYVNDLRNFPKNIEINTVMQYESGRWGNVDSAPDSRSLRLGVHYSMTQLAEDSTFRPRYADDRVGYFLNVRKDFDVKHEGLPNFDRFIIRWNLEKADPSLAMSPPKKPITFYVENTTPYEYRDMVKEGILMWNKAFEAAGFKDAVQAVIMPDDAEWDPADMRYNVIRWINSHQGSFAGLGPARTNPFTGEILDADVLIEGEAIRSIKRFYERYVTPVNAYNAFEVLPENTNNRFGGWAKCSFGMGLANEANFALLAMQTRGDMKPGAAVPEEFIRSYIKDLVAHEVGHVLGLRHNFKASSMLPVSKIHDQEATRSIGLVSSVMDYNAVNVAPPGVKQGDYFPEVVGPYDVWAIEYGYSVFPETKGSDDEISHLKKIASKSADPNLPYATDEDTFGISPMSPDPRSSHWDLGADGLEYAKTQVALIREQLQKFPSVVVQEGDSFVAMRDTLSGLIGMYGRTALVTCKFLGGAYVERNHMGDPGAKDPIVPVAAAKQREALDFLAKNVFAENAFHVSADVLRKLAPDRWSHWGWYGAWSAQIDYPLNDRVLGIQRAALGWAMQGMVMRRILENENRFASGEEPFRLPELFESIEKAIWSSTQMVEASSKKGTMNIGELSANRRALQRDHVRLLTELLHNGAGYVPEDARTQAWASLNRIQGLIAKSGADSMSGYTGPHFAETQSRIKKALDAHMSMSSR